MAVLEPLLPTGTGCLPVHSRRLTDGVRWRVQVKAPRDVPEVVREGPCPLVGRHHKQCLQVRIYSIAQSVLVTAHLVGFKQVVTVAGQLVGAPSPETSAITHVLCDSEAPVDSFSYSRMMVDNAGNHEERDSGATGERSEDSGAADLRDTVIEWARLPVGARSADVLTARPKLLTDAGELALLRLLRTQTERETVRHLEDLVVLLADSRRRGVAETYDAMNRMQARCTDAYGRERAARDRYAAGEAEALDEAIAAAAEVTAELANFPTRRQEALVDEAHLLLERTNSRRSRDDLDAAAEKLRAVVSRPVSMPPVWGKLVISAAAALRMRHEGMAAARGRADLSDLDAAVDLALHAVRAASPDSRALPGLVAALGEALRARHAHGGPSEDLGAAIRALGQATEGLQDGLKEDRETLLSALDSLGGALAERFQLDGLSADLDGAVTAFEDVVVASAPDAPERPARLTNLAGMLLLRYEQRAGSRVATSDEDGGDLDRSTALLDEATGLILEGSGFAPSVFGGLTNAWRHRYERTGDPTHLERALSHGENAVAAARASATPDLPSHLVALAVVRQLRARQTGKAVDLDHAVALCREALEVTPKTSFRVRDRGNSLGIALLERYLAQGSPTDLDEALSWLTRLDAEVNPRSERLAPNVAGLLFNTGNGLWIGYRRTGDLMSLNQAIARFARAVAAVDSASLDGRRFRNSLAVALAERHACFGDVADLRQAVGLLQEAWSTARPASPEWLVYVTNAATASRLLHERTGHAAALDEAVAALETTLDGLSTLDNRRGDLLDSLGSALAARYADTGDQDDLVRAHACLREAAGIMTSSPEHPLTLGHLARVLTELHLRTGDAHYAEEAVNLLRDAVTAGLRSSPESALGNARFWGVWAERHSSPAAAAEAFELGIEASYQLFRAQVVRSYRWNRLRACGDVHVRAARNQVARREPGLYAAVVALERGRALVLSETLAVRRSEVDRLERAGHAGLANRYHQTVARLAELSRLMPEE